MIIIKNQQKLLLYGFLICFVLISPTLFNNTNSLKTQTSDHKDYKIEPSETSKKIVASNTIIQDIVENVVGEGIDVIVSGAEDPHSYEPTSSEVEALDNADVIFRLGLENVEPWWESDWESGTTVIELIDNNMLEEDPLIGVKNPHIWMNPENIKNFTRQINHTMVNEDPPNADDFSSNTDTYIDILNDLLTEIQDAKSDMQDLKVVVNHPAFFYFFNLLDIERLATIEKGEGKEPSAEDIAEIISKAQDEEADLVVANPQHQSENVYEIARESDLKIALLTPLLNVKVEWDGETKTIDTYEKMIQYDLWALQNPSEPPLILWLVYLLIGIIVVAIIGVLIYLRRR